MSFQITVEPSGRHFFCDTDETVLNAALQANVGLPYGCKSGSCGTCKGKILRGNVTHRAHQQKALTTKEQEHGWALFCCAEPQSDLVIEAREVAGSTDFPVKKMPCRVQNLQRVASDVIVMTLQLPAAEQLRYRAGQYIEFMLKDGVRRSYSIANAPLAQPQLTLHIRHIAGGLFTDQLFSTIQVRDILRFEGPLGTFFLREDSSKPIVLLASGTGFAPVKAIVEFIEHKRIQRPLTLYWGGRRPADLYMRELCQEWTQRLPNFRFVPVVSDALPEDAWRGRSGWVHRAVIEDFPDLSTHQVYACGAPAMVDAAQREFVAQCGLPAAEFFADAFTTAADLARE